MSNSTPESPPASIHILNKANYSKHTTLTLPASPLPPLPLSSIRLRPRILGLTTNNLTYARHGHLMGWYDIYPLPPATPAPYNDTSTYGRIAAWGYADIVESNVDGVRSGMSVYGFLPISTGIETITVELAADKNGDVIPHQIIATDGHRQHLWKIYNRYQICASISTLEATRTQDSLGLDALMQGLFATGYNLSTYAFAPSSAARIHPSGTGPWSTEDADLNGAGIVILNASGKTGMSFAYALRKCRHVSEQPALIVGVGSDKSVDAITKSGLYDKVFSNSDAGKAKDFLGNNEVKRIILLDFGARPATLPTWQHSLSSPIPFTLITIGGEVKVQDPETAKKRLAELGTTILVNASALRERGIECGGEEYFRGFYEKWEGARGVFGGSLGLEWGEGVEGWEGGWERLCGDGVGAGVGLVYRV